MKFLGLGLALPALNSCDSLIEHFSYNKNLEVSPGLEFKSLLGTFKSLEASSLDELVLPEGYSYDIICSYGDVILRSKPENESGESAGNGVAQRHREDLKFGYNNDYIGFIPLSNDEALLAVNHEFLDPLDIPVEAEQRKAVGVSIVKIKKDSHGLWKFDEDPESQREFNRRITANTVCTVSGAVAELYSEMTGTLANCSGAITPWNTVLTCEENYYLFDEVYKWKNFDAKQYGWIVEINPLKPDSKPIKHTALGRMAHENCALVKSHDERMVVYMGDDKERQFIYKFVSKNPVIMPKNLKDLDLETHLSPFSEGDLYVAKLDKNLNFTEINSGKGKWLKLSIDNPILKSKFKSQAELLIETRLAAKYLAATPMDRPESLSVSPKDGSIVAALTYSPAEKNNFGSLFRIVEDNSHSESMTFRYENLIIGGKTSGFACPDNIHFDKNSNLWLATDIDGAKLNKAPYDFQGNNSLFVIPSEGPHAGKALRFASAPAGAEFCGICFSEDSKTLFISVQHPGEGGLQSRWPYGTNVAKSSIVAIYQELEWW